MFGEGPRDVSEGADGLHRLGHAAQVPEIQIRHYIKIVFFKTKHVVNRVLLRAQFGICKRARELSFFLPLLLSLLTDLDL